MKLITFSAVLLVVFGAITAITVADAHLNRVFAEVSTGQKPTRSGNLLKCGTANSVASAVSAYFGRTVRSWKRTSAGIVGASATDDLCRVLAETEPVHVPGLTGGKFNGGSKPLTLHSS
jgi:hypothetical protein